MSVAQKYKEPKPSLLQKSQFKWGLAEISLSTNIQHPLLYRACTTAKTKMEPSARIVIVKERNLPVNIPDIFSLVIFKNKIGKPNIFYILVENKY